MAFFGTTTTEYKAVQCLTPELVNAVQNDLCEISNQLLSRGMITEASHGALEQSDNELQSSPFLGFSIPYIQ